MKFSKIAMFFSCSYPQKINIMDIVVENLTKTYGTQKAVDHISFRVKTGEVLGFLGPNGAGKTTTMKAITSFLVPDEGSIHVGDFSVDEQAEEVKKHIGYLPESNPLYEEMPIIDYLKFVAKVEGIPANRIEEKLREVIRVCGIQKEKHKKIGELSKGYKQRVGLAQALIHDPDVLILDEPTTGLDPNQIIEIRELIKKIGREKTVILSSHILAEVEATCDRILIINKGKIVAEGTTDELRKKSQAHEVVKVSIEEGDVNEIFKSLQGLDETELVDFIDREKGEFEIQSRTDQTARRAIFNLCVEKHWVLTQMTPIETKLEDVFRQLTMN
jgi:ABC-2 type transport system ATP-binding protein